LCFFYFVKKYNVGNSLFKGSVMRKYFIPVFLFFLGFVLPHMAIAMEIDLVGFSISSSQVDEGDKSIQLKVERKVKGPAPKISVEYRFVIGQGATSSIDYDLLGDGMLTWGENDTDPKFISVKITDDLIVESEEAFTIALFNCRGLGSTLSTTSSCNILTKNHTVTINDNDIPGEFVFESVAVNADEGKVAHITVNRINGADGAVSVDFQTIEGSALSGSDYTHRSGTLSWDDQEDGSKTFDIPILKDSEVESKESFEVQLFNTSNQAIIKTGVTTVSITDATEPGILSFINTAITAREGDKAIIAVTRNGGADGAISVDYKTDGGTATAGSNYVAASGTLSWNDQESGAKVFEIEILTDTQNDDSVEFSIQLSNATAGVSILENTANVTIVVDDVLPPLGNLLVEESYVSVNEGVEAQITLTRENGLDGALSINYQTENVSALAGEDYIETSGILTWADKETGSKTIKIVTNKDANAESTESFKITFDSNDLEFVEPVTVSIIDQQSTGTITLTKSTESVTEGSFLKVEVIRQGGVNGVISVDYATSNIILEGNDFTAGDSVGYTPVSGTLNWSQGDDSTKIVRVPINNDFTNDRSESFRFALSNVQGTTLGDFQQMIVTIENTQSSLEELPGLSPEQKQMAKMLTGACDGAVGDLVARCTEMLQGEFTENELKDILQQLLPTEVGSMGSTGITLGTTQLKNLMQRLGDLRRGQRGFSADGLTMNIQGESLPVGKILASGSEPLGGGGGASSDIVENERFGFFIHGKINVGDKDQTNRETGFEFSTQGVTVGMDYRFNDELVMGTAFGYGHTNTRYDQSRGEMDANAISASFYGSYYLPKSFYVDWILAYGFHDYEADRNIRYDGTDYAASSTPEGNEYDVAVSFGKDINWQQWQLNSYARLEYQVLDIEGYQESGGHGFALRIGEQAVNSFTTVLGGQLAFNWSQSWGVLSPAARFEWEHQYMDSSRNITASFVNSNTNGGVLSIATENVDRNYFNIGASLNATFDYGRSAFVMYETRLGQSDISSHMIEIGVRIPF